MGGEKECSTGWPKIPMIPVFPVMIGSEFISGSYGDQIAYQVNVYEHEINLFRPILHQTQAKSFLQ